MERLAGNSRHRVVRMKKNNTAKRVFIIVALGIPLLNFFVFFVGMNAKMIWDSFFRNHPYNPSLNKFYGLNNYINSIKEFFRLKGNTGGEELCPRTIWNTLSLIFLSVFINMPISLLCAFGIYRKFKGHRFFRFILYAPCMLSTVVLCLSFNAVIGQGGPVMSLLEQVLGPASNIVRKGLFGNVSTAWPTLLVFSVWTGISTNLLFFISGFARLPESCIESAMLDGAKEFTIFRKISIPLIWPTVVTMMMAQVAGAFSWYMPTLLLTNGKNGTNTIGFLIINFTNNSMTNSGPMVNLYSAIGVLVAIVGTVVTLLSRWIGNRMGAEEEY